jgi:hypothetical protein
LSNLKKKHNQEKLKHKDKKNNKKDNKIRSKIINKANEAYNIEESN